MAHFDFSTLNSTDLEELVRDLLNAKERSRNSGIEYRTFKPGKDKGIDLLYSTNLCKYEIVGQVKHYFKSGYNALINIIKSKEVSKVNKLTPNRYIFITSVELSPANKEEIKDHFNPFILSLSDIYSSSDLNMLIEQYPSVLDNHFKIWFSSTLVLKRLLNYNIEGRSNEFVKHNLEKRLRLYVSNPSFYKAQEIIEENNFIIITGEPGCGKTTLAEILIYNYIKEGFSFTYVYDDIKEIEPVLSNDNEKQLFYYDDFLGHNSYEILRAKSSESSFMRILRRISNSKNKYLILTTRTLIYNVAIQESENLRRFNDKIKSSILNIDIHSQEMIERITINHIDESQVNSELKEILLDQVEYISCHENFSPRSVEFITSPEQIGSFSPEQLKIFIINNFNKPDEIWRHAYEQQIGFEERLLLNTLISFGDQCLLSMLRTAFYHRLRYESAFNNYKSDVNIFSITFRKLLGGFIIPSYSYDSHDSTSDIHYTFINHSLTDFLINYISNDEEESLKILKSAFYIEQVNRRFIPIYPETEHLSHLYKDIFLDKNDFFIKEETKDINRFTLALLQNSYLEENDAAQHIFDNVSMIENWGFLAYNNELAKIFMETLDYCTGDEIIIEIMQPYAERFLPHLILSTNDLDELDDLIKEAYGCFAIDEQALFLLSNNENNIDHVSMLIQENFDYVIDELVDNATSIDIVNNIHDHFIELRDRLRNYNFNVDIDFDLFNHYNWNEIVSKNYGRSNLIIS